MPILRALFARDRAAVNGMLVRIALAALIVNSAYLAAFASASGFYYTNVAAHVVLGVAALVVIVLRTARWRHWSWAARLAGAGLAAACLSGLWLAYVGGSRAQQAVVNLHGALAIAAAVLLALWSFARAARLSGRQRTVATAIAILLCVGIGVTVTARTIVKQRFAGGFRIVNPLTPPLTMDHEGNGPGTPFFPSSARTNVGGTIPANFFMTSATCARCHKDIYDQWNSSAHHFSSFNNQWYRRSIEYMQEVTGTQPSKWCAGCHDQVVKTRPEAKAPGTTKCTTCHKKG